MLLRKSADSLARAPELDTLLGRRAVNLDTPELQRFIAGKRVMITGAGGSIGSELCRQSARFLPDRLILVERAEGALFEIDRELQERWIGVDVRPCVADVCDEHRMSRLFSDHRPDIVFHAAAHKHVPMMEANPGEAIRNNIFGTQVVADVAVESGVDAFVLISTDKAINPTSVMGASKRVAEMIVQSSGACRRSSSTRMLAVRFGNVLGSSGSVVPIFKRQIEAGGPVTVTHPDMRRYFMTIPEATQLVMQAGAIGQGGEVFVLDMGEPVRILDLARQMIEQAGLVEDKDIQIRFTGMRPGEKLFEELARPDDRTRPTSHPKIRVWELPEVSPVRLQAMLADLKLGINAPALAAMELLSANLPDYRPTTSLTKQTAIDAVAA
jgi:FlaA1/EpsC-like NDP-sugar epimerase